MHHPRDLGEVQLRAHIDEAGRLQERLGSRRLTGANLLAPRPRRVADDSALAR